MRLGEAFWIGRDEFVSVQVAKMAPRCLHPGPYISAAKRATGRYREGFAFDAKIIDGFDQIKPFFFGWRASMETAIAATECTERATQAIKTLDATVEAFNKNLKNDLASMKAASQRIQNESAQMRERYLEAQSILTSPEFERAIENAERMAIALQSLASLSQTSLNVSVLAAGNGDRP